MQEKVFVKNKKGLKLACLVEKPKRKGRHPCVVLLHGFKGYKEEPTYTELAKQLLDAGISSIRFDASGFGESGGTLKKDYRFTNYVSDVEMIYHYIIKQDFVDKDRIGVMGQSMGGMMAVVFAARKSGIKAVVCVSAPGRIGTKDELGRNLEKWKKRGYFEVPSSRMGKEIRVPYDFIKDALRWNILDYARMVRVPSFYILGLEDKTVLPEQTVELFESANEPKKLWRVAEMDHFYKNNPDILDRVNRKIVRFFVNNL